ncbi:MAG: hypothetical protein HY692_01915 [Cyanobacteria bacterium NC_groundwater_1444_Ag_S-0.65um_54_12]|nr:hypothetical protein [Cyanobacteria bacterium NC_groundwater_1444_Ag_S-0.65um_54_12]
MLHNQLWSLASEAVARERQVLWRSLRTWAKETSESAISATVDTHIQTEIHEFAQHFRMATAPRVVRQLAKLDAFWGRDTTRQIARDHLGHRGGFLVDLVANAERRGYPDLKGLQESLPKEWLSRAPCPFCHPHELLQPAKSIILESENFVATPNIRQLFLSSEDGGHVMIFAKHHRSTPAALPDQLRQELVTLLRRVKQEMTEIWSKPVSLFINGMPGVDKHLLEDVDSHAHIQLFSGNTTITEAVLKEAGLSREQLFPVRGFADYFRFYDQGKLRGRYILTLDANEQGYLILLGNRQTAGGLAMRNVRTSLGLPRWSGDGRIDPNPQKAILVAAALQARFSKKADAPSTRAVLATVPVTVGTNNT